MKECLLLMVELQPRLLYDAGECGGGCREFAVMGEGGKDWGVVAPGHSCELWLELDIFVRV